MKKEILDCPSCKQKSLTKFSSQDGDILMMCKCGYMGFGDLEERRENVMKAFKEHIRKTHTVKKKI